MNTLVDTLTERVDKLIESQKGNRLLSVTPTSVAIGELAARSDGLEKAIREIAVEVQKLSASWES